MAGKNESTNCIIGDGSIFDTSGQTEEAFSAISREKKKERAKDRDKDERGT